MRAAGIIIASAYIGGFALAAYAAMARVNHDIDEAFGDWPFIPADLMGVAATREKRLGGGSGLRGQRPVTNANRTIQTEQTNSLLSNPPVSPGRIAK